MGIEPFPKRKILCWKEVLLDELSSQAGGKELKWPLGAESAPEKSRDLQPQGTKCVPLTHLSTPVSLKPSKYYYSFIVAHHHISLGEDPSSIKECSPASTLMWLVVPRARGPVKPCLDF